MPIVIIINLYSIFHSDKFACLFLCAFKAIAKDKKKKKKKKKRVLGLHIQSADNFY